MWCHATGFSIDYNKASVEALDQKDSASIFLKSYMAISSHFLHVYAKPKNHQDKIEHWIEERGKYILQLRIMAPPEGGKANKAIIELLAKTLSIAKSNITLISGATTRHKTFKITPWSALLAAKLPKRNPVLTLF